MKTNRVLVAMLGATLLSGVVLAQADEAQGPDNGDGPGFRPMCRCGGNGAGPMMDGCGTRGAMGGAQMRCPQMGGMQMRGPRMAARGGFGCEGSCGPARLPDPKALKEAGATDQQIESLKKFEDERQIKQVDLKAAVEKAELTFGQLMKNEAADEAVALKAAEALSQARAEAFKADISAQLKVRTILGTDVLKKLHEMRSADVAKRCRGDGSDGGCPRMGRQAAPDQAQAREPRAQPPPKE